ncbi:DUF882 domain-containing protein [Oceanibacterium hippocampi]|uniref:Murein endopeptidase K n=1 Tax=Oceanibacterium hippocampi TaxID=745714 RepID=A0A1Y5TA28_9PROT|nr:DUF882 domain-containing protein [Oceanibacterium hippocampi]SLN59061.1 Peptidase M15 [Oceanibacterium hippocampi]
MFLSGLAPSAVRAALPRSTHRTLSLVSLNTGERLKATYWEGGAYQPDAIDEFNRLLRDWRSGEIHPIDPKLLDLVHALGQKLGCQKPIQIISGYRSPKTNAALARKSNGVAKKSMHMLGQAIDIRLPGCELARLRNAARAMKAGGVGYYPKSNFVHLDTGRVRSWGG